MSISDEGTVTGSGGWPNNPPKLAALRQDIQRWGSGAWWVTPRLSGYCWWTAIFGPCGIPAAGERSAEVRSGVRVGPSVAWSGAGAWRGGVGCRRAAARRLAESGRTVIRPGLTDREFDEVEQRFGFQFADEHRVFLAEGLPVWTEGDDDPNKTTGLGWPDWRGGDPGRLREHLDFAVQCALEEVERGYWHPWWGVERPAGVAEALQLARDRLAADDSLVPVNVHRYLPAGRGRWGHPVMSIWGIDVIYYGMDLADYVDREFTADNENDGEPESRPRARRPCRETFWVQLADWSENGCPFPPV